MPSITSTSEHLTVVWDDGVAADFPAIWLRDNLPSGRHRAEGQRTFDINELDRPSIVAAALDDDHVDVDFGDVRDRYPVAWLAGFRDGRTSAGRATPVRRLWDGSRQETLEFAEYDRLRTDSAARLSWLSQLRDEGFALVRNTPAVEGTVLSVVDLFGYVRETNYGRLFDVIVRPDPANLANTSARIGMHTDNPYRNPVPGLQLLHCIVNESDGGDSQLCDGYRVAEELRRDDPAAFDLLTTHPVGFRYLDDGVADLQSYQPLITVDALGEIQTIRYNARSAAPFHMPSSVIDDYYDAYRAFAERLNDPAALIEFRLGPGDCMVFDNERVLHGRSAYTVGHRHLQGCYADKDSLQSTIRVLESW